MTDLLDLVEVASGSAYVARAFPAWCERYQLSPAECRIVRLAVDGGQLVRNDLAAELGVKPSTLKTQTSKICKKVGVLTFRDVIVSVLRAALQEAGAGG